MATNPSTSPSPGGPAAWPERPRPNGRRACRACGSHWVVRSRRLTPERVLLALVGKRPYRCLACGTRYFGRPASA